MLHWQCSVNVITHTMHQRRFAVGIVLMLLLALPATATASSFAAHEEYYLGSGESVLENLYVVAGRVGVAGQVLGDLLTAGGTLNVTGDILDDALVLGGTVNVLGGVGDDLRAVGGQVTISGPVGGDVVAAGGTVHILADATVGGDVVIAGGEVVIDGLVTGNVRTVGGRLVLNGVIIGDVNARVGEDLTIGNGAAIGGTLTYRAPHEAAIPESAQISGIAFSETTGSVDRTDAVGVAAGVGALLAGLFFSFKFLAWLGFALLLVLAWKRWATTVVEGSLALFWKNLGQGVVFAIITPLVIALLLISFIGTFVGVAALAAYAILFLIARAYVGIILGAWLGKVITKRKTLQVTVPWIVAGVVVAELLVLVPVIGWLITMALMLVVFGYLARTTFQSWH